MQIRQVYSTLISLLFTWLSLSYYSDCWYVQCHRNTVADKIRYQWEILWKCLTMLLSIWKEEKNCRPIVHNFKTRSMLNTSNATWQCLQFTLQHPERNAHHKFLLAILIYTIHHWLFLGRSQSNPLNFIPIPIIINPIAISLKL